MAAIDFSPQTTARDEVTTTPMPRSRALTLEQLAYLGLFGVALLTHLWGLGDRALHHDETHHAYFSWQLFMGQGYTHDPLLHGPFLYYFNALIYFLFGDTNMTARLGVALFGSALVVLPYFIRRELGRGAALLAATYLLMSPAFLYVGRFIRHDMYAVTFEMLTLIGIVRYASTRQTRWLYLTAAALGLMFTTMESFFLFVAIFAPLLVVLFFWRVWKPGIAVAAVLGLAIIAFVFVLPGEPQRSGDGVARAQGQYVCPSSANPFPPDNPMRYTPGPIFGFPPLATTDNNYSLCVRNQPDDQLGVYFIKLGQFFANPAVLIALALLVAGVAAMYVLVWRRRGADGLTAWQRARQEHDDTLEAFASLGRDRRVLVALAIFFTIYALLFSAFLMNVAGIVTGATGSLLYWLGQHSVQRGNQPHYYYLLLLIIYEPLALLWSIVGVVAVAVMLVRHFRQPVLTNGARVRTINWSLALPAILAWWSVAAFAVYSWAGEKMPWLTIHVALPLVLLGAWALNRTLRWGFRYLLTNDFVVGDGEQNAPADGVHGSMLQRFRAPLFYLGVFCVITVFCFVLLSILTNDANQYSTVPWLPLLALVVFITITACYALLRGWREALGGLALAVTIVTALYTVRSSSMLNYRWGDVPREMMIFVQTSPDVARVMNDLDQASIRHTGGLNLKIWYDNETIWGWYFRNFPNGERQQPTLSTPPGPDVKAVFMLQENIDNNPQNLQNLQGFLIQRYPLRWWFPEDQTYRLPSNWRTAPVSPGSPLLMRLLREPFDGQTLAQTWQFLMYRKLPAPLGSTDFVLAVRPELANEFGMGIGDDKTNP
ncbi:MAG TPA: flippase activity-associated protein Agl23 [Roseiflexaceae bacterium]|nr:flippase activity-associated protein Agl23 [Roseiflexaceae bacterium]